MTDAIDAIRARLAAATSGLTPSPTRVNWAGNPGWFLPDALTAHLLAELDHADQLVEQQADRIDQLETAGQALADALEWQVDNLHGEMCAVTRKWRDCADTDGHEREQYALAAWQQATGHAAPAITP